jgi:hypothetical protein
MNRLLFSFMFFGVVMSGCAAHVGVGGMATLPSDAASNCAAQCKTIGLPLDSVVIMANNVGCVCRNPVGPTTGKEGAGQAAASAGMAALLVSRPPPQQQQQQ